MTVNKEMERMWLEAAWLAVRYYPNIWRAW